MVRAKATDVAKQVAIYEVCQDCSLIDSLNGESPQWADPSGNTLYVSQGLKTRNEFQVSGFPSDEEVANAFNSCEGTVQDKQDDRIRICGAIAILRYQRRKSIV